MLLYTMLCIFITPLVLLIVWVFSIKAIPGVSQVEGTRLVYQYNYTAWPDFGVPRNLSSIIDFLETVNLKQESLSETGPMVIHCRSVY